MVFVFSLGQLWSEPRLENGTVLGKRNRPWKTETEPRGPQTQPFPLKRNCA